MSHLSRDERLLAVDEVLEAPRAAHLTACAECRAEVEALRGVVARVRAVDVPEPSPLFWDHLASRVGDAIAREPVPAAAPAWWRMPQWGWAAAAMVLVAAGSGYFAGRRPAAPDVVVAHGGAPAGEPVDASPVTSSPVTPSSGEAGGPRDDGWALIAAMADETGLTPADASALAPLAGQSELSISQLSKEERAALINELEAALAPHSGREG
jgi:hypothetical protein